MQTNVSESPYTPYDGYDPYNGVETFIGDKYKNMDPDFEWLKSTEERLDSMPEDVYITLEEHDEIINALTRIEYKHDLRRDIYVQLAESGSAWIPPHTALTLKLESFCLDIMKDSPPSGVTYNEVVPSTGHVKIMLEWYYLHPEVQEYLVHNSFQELIWKVQAFVHDQHGYDIFTNNEKYYLREIFGDNPQIYLQETQNSLKSYVSHSNNSADLFESLMSTKWQNVGDMTETFTKDVGGSPPDGNYFNIGDNLIGRFVSDYSFYSSELEIINNTDDDIKFSPLDYTIGVKGTGNYQPIAVGMRKVADQGQTEEEKLVEDINPTEKIKNAPVCNMTDAHRARILELAQPSEWPMTPYKAKNSKMEGVVCNQFVRMVYKEAGIKYPDTTTKTLPTSPFFQEVTGNPLDGDIILWRNSSGSVHHMGIWIENPEEWGGKTHEQVLSAITHNGRSKLRVDHDDFETTVDWTNPAWFDKDADRRVFRFKGAGNDAPDCPLK